jgi:hypothetical protein
LGSRDQKDRVSKPTQANNSRAGKVAQVVECLPSKYEALSSNPVLERKKKKKKKTTEKRKQEKK